MSNQIGQASEWDWRPYTKPEAPNGSVRPDQLPSDFPRQKPGVVLQFKVQNVRFVGVALDEYGCDSGRQRMLVYCEHCTTLVHGGTTGPLWNAREHAEICKAVDRNGKPYRKPQQDGVLVWSMEETV